MVVFYRLQINTAKKIICGFLNSVRTILLIAQCQSGKTHSALYAALTMLKNKNVENIVIFSGISEKSLKEQWIESINESIEQFGLIDKEAIHTNLQGKSLGRTELYSAIHIVWSKDMKDHEPIPNSIYLHDESHYAQTIGNRPHRWLEEHNISLNGNDTILKELNIYWLSISATPCSELSDIKKENQNKHMIVLPVDEKYTGIKQFVDNGQFYGTNQGEIDKRLFKRMCKRIPDKSYCLIRYTSNKIKNLIYKVTKKYGIKVLTYNSTKSSDLKSIDELEKEPDVKTMVFVSGKLRCGKRLPIQHVSTIINTSKNPNTDTILQGLIGRCCGYNKSKFKIRIYISEMSMRGILEYKYAVDNNFNIGFGHSKNVPKYADTNPNTTTITVDRVFPKTNEKEIFHKDLTDLDFRDRFTEMLQVYINQRKTELVNIKLSKTYYNKKKLKKIFKKIKKKNPNVQFEKKLFYNDTSEEKLSKLTVHPSKKDNKVCLREICKTIGKRISGSKKFLVNRILSNQEDSNEIHIISLKFHYSTGSSSSSAIDLTEYKCTKCTKCEEQICVNECKCNVCMMKVVTNYVIPDLARIIICY